MPARAKVNISCMVNIDVALLKVVSFKVTCTLLVFTVIVKNEHLNVNMVGAIIKH